MNEGHGNRLAVLVLAVIAVAACLFVLRDILIPFVAAVFLAILFRPLIDVVKRIGAPTWVALLVVLGVSGAALWGISAIIGIGVDGAVAKAPEYSEKIQRLATSAAQSVSQIPGGSEVLKHVDGIVTPEAGIAIASRWLSSAVSIVGDGVIALLYLVFIVLGSGNFGVKLRAAMNAAGTSDLVHVYMAVNDKVLKYLRTKTLFNLLNAAVVYGVLFVFGVDFAPVLAMLAFFFAYLPNIGSFITVVVSGAIVLIQFESPGQALLVVAILIVLANTIGNVLEPRAMGQSLNLSPLVVLFSLVFWGWMWGIVGMILSVPIMAVLTVVMEQFPTTRPIAILLGNSLPETKTTA